MNTLAKRTNTKLLIAVSLSLLTSASYADWGLRLGTDNHHKEYNTKKNRYDGLVGLQYRGNKFNASKSGLSYDFTNSEKQAAEVLLRIKHDGFKSSDDALFKGMSKRKASLDIGGRAIVNTGVLGNAVVEVTRDVNASKGFEAGVKLGGISPHAPHWTGQRKLNVAAMGGLHYQSAKVADYYYGVKSSEATANRKAYKAKSAVEPYAGVEAQMNINKHFTIDGGLSVIKRAKSIRNSPLTNDKKYRVGANIGFSYWF